MVSRIFIIAAFLSVCLTSFSQRIIYSEPDNDDIRRMNFEIIGKVSSNYLIYKSIRGKSYISVYDNDMKQVSRIEQDYLPEDRLINVDFIAYPDFAYMVYQYQKKNVVYYNAVKIDGSGKKASDIMEVDTSHIGFAANNKIYSTVISEDKNSIVVFKVNSRNRNKYLITTVLLDNKLSLRKRSSIHMPMEDQHDYLDEFAVDNDGDLVFVKYSRQSNDISDAALVWKPAMADSFTTVQIEKRKIYLDQPYIKVDNVNKRYFLTSFYYKQRRGNVEGFYFFVFDKKLGQPSMENTVVLGEDIRKEARGDAAVKNAFNDYFIKHIIIRRDGGFLIGSEAYYTTSRYNSWNRWNYLYGSPMSPMDYISYSPLYSSWYWRSRMQNNLAVRHHADNITILSFDNTGKMEWSGVIHKEQYDDESDERISYQLMNTGGQLHFVFNQEEKRAKLLNDYTLTADGKINRNPTLKNLDRGYEFLPKYGKQVSTRQLLIPCFYRNYICFAKIDYNS